MALESKCAPPSRPYKIAQRAPRSCSFQALDGLKEEVRALCKAQPGATGLVPSTPKLFLTLLSRFVRYRSSRACPPRTQDCAYGLRPACIQRASGAASDRKNDPPASSERARTLLAHAGTEFSRTQLYFLLFDHPMDADRFPTASRRVDVWWPGDNEWYAATVLKTRTMLHNIDGTKTLCHEIFCDYDLDAHMQWHSLHNNRLESWVAMISPLTPYARARKRCVSDLSHMSCSSASHLHVSESAESSSVCCLLIPLLILSFCFSRMARCTLSEPAGPP